MTTASTTTVNPSAAATYANNNNNDNISNNNNTVKLKPFPLLWFLEEGEKQQEATTDNCVVYFAE